MKKIAIGMAVALCSLASVNAQTLINVDFGTGSSPTMSGAAILGSAGDVWNPISADQNGVALLNSAGTAVTGTSWTYTTGHGLFDNTGGTAMDAATTPLMEDYMYGNAGNEGGTIFGLTPGAAFTLVIYGAGDSVGQSDIMSLSGDMTGGNTGSILTTTGVDRKISNGIGDAYNTFTGIVGASGQIQVVLAPNTAVNPSNTNAAFNGFQILEAPVPEPSTYALMLGGLGLLAFVTLRRRQVRG
jgi:hypothetical protein